MKHDPFACDAALLQHNTAHLTMIEGNIVYRNDF
jgi:predicted amidohydrolase YtcJ